ncbi:MAG TPA: radical SAM protein [Pyrinomonadaceae bacterium]|nr:radical SAM protein [Pyrinomonadaceae bacterium]
MSEAIARNSTVYGPVRSWRLGLSLGIDLLFVDSICSFDCVYCQLGRINRLTTKREIFVPTEKVIADLKKAGPPDVDAVTFSGNGEPTLALNLGVVIKAVKALVDAPIVVLTNSSLLGDPAVRRDLMAADKVFCKLDAVSNDALRRIDRPAVNMDIDEIAVNIRRFREEFKGEIALQTMLLSMPAESEIARYAKLVRDIMPDELQLNAPTRPVPVDWDIENRGNHEARLVGYRQLKHPGPVEMLLVAGRIETATGIRVLTPPAKKEKAVDA